MKYWFDALDIQYAGDVLVRGIDGAGAVLRHPKAMEELRALAGRLPGGPPGNPG